MQSSLDHLTFIYPEQLFLEFSVEEREKTWAQTQNQSYSNAASFWNAYLNCLCLNSFLTYLEAQPNLGKIPKVWPSTTELPSFWEVINGTVIQLGEIRLVLIPSEQSHFTEFRVQREWLDIPDWAGNYYLAVDLNLENCWLQVWGYATHQQLSQEGQYDRMDETYVLDADELIEDLSVMWVVRELRSSGKPEVKPLLTLSSSEAANMLEQLGQPTPYSPRLDVLFAKWAALVADDRWRQKLYQRRLGQFVTVANSSQTLINLGQWFQEVFESGWQSLDTLLNADSGNLAFSFRQNQYSTQEENQKAVKGVKLIDLDGKLANQSVALLVDLTIDTSQRAKVRVQLYPVKGQTYLPPKIKLTALAPSGVKIAESIARSQDKLIQLKRFTCPTGKSFSIQVTLDDFSITENFLMESVAERER